MKILAEVCQCIFTSFERPSSYMNIGANIIRLTGRTTILAAVSAITSAVLNKYSKQEGPLPTITSHLLKISLSTGATCAAVLICYVYRVIKSNDVAKANPDTVLFEKIITYTSGIASLSTSLVSIVFRGNETVMSITRPSRLPLFVCTTTALIISIFHQHQLKKVEHL